MEGGIHPPNAVPQKGGREECKGKNIGDELWTVSGGGFSATCDAYAMMPGDELDRGEIWFLSMVGSQTALKAVWGCLLNLPPHPIFLTPGVEGLALDGEYYRCSVPRAIESRWSAKLSKLPNGMGYHAMVFSKLAEYANDSEPFLLLSDREDGEEEQHHRFLDRRVTTPTHPGWAHWLWRRGLENDEIRPLRCQGIRGWLCLPNVTRLERDIGEAIRAREIGV